MTVVYYSCLDERWKEEDIINSTMKTSLSMILTELTEKEFLPTDIVNTNLKNEKIITGIDNVIKELDNNNKILIFIYPDNPIFKDSQYIAITDYNKDTETFIVKDPYLYTTKYSKAIKQNLLNYKTVNGSSNLISVNDALVGFDIHLPKSTLETISNELKFYSISIKKEIPLYTMKVITNTKVTIRTQPDETSTKVHNVYNNDIVEIFEISDNNYGRTNNGWLELSSLVLSEPVQKVVKEKTTIRKNPENGSQKLGRYDKNTTITITKVITDWCRTNKGWITISSLE